MRGFVTVLPKFPRIPSQFLIDSYKDGTLKTSDYEFIRSAIGIAQDNSIRLRIAETLLKLFSSSATLNHFLAPMIFGICRRLVGEDGGRTFIMKVVHDCLGQYAQLEGSQKMASIAKHQPMYFVQKGNEKFKKEEEEEFLIGEKSAKNLLALVEKLM